MHPFSNVEHSRVVPGQHEDFALSAPCCFRSRELPWRGHFIAMLKHGKYRSAEYAVWYHMKARCFNPRDKRFSQYGGRGITVCERWMEFTNFFHDMGLRPSSGHSIDRIDNDGNYEPENCKWSTRSEQQKNKRYLGRAPRKRNIHPLQ